MRQPHRTDEPIRVHFRGERGVSTVAFLFLTRRALRRPDLATEMQSYWHTGERARILAEIRFDRLGGGETRVFFLRSTASSSKTGWVDAAAVAPAPNAVGSSTGPIHYPKNADAFAADVFNGLPLAGSTLCGKKLNTKRDERISPTPDRVTCRRCLASLRRLAIERGVAPLERRAQI